MKITKTIELDVTAIKGLPSGSFNDTNFNIMGTKNLDILVFAHQDYHRCFALR